MRATLGLALLVLANSGTAAWAECVALDRAVKAALANRTTT